MGILFCILVACLILGKPIVCGSAESLCSLPESTQIALLGYQLGTVRQNRFAVCQSTQIDLWDTTRIRFGKAGAHPQLAWETAIAPETLYLITTFSFLKAIAVSAILS